MDDLEVISPAGVESHQVAGRTIAIRPVSVRQLPGFTRALRPVIPSLQAVLERADNLTGDVAISIGMDLIAEHGERLIEACAIATKCSTEEIGDMDPLEFTELAIKVVRVNADFFARRLRPIFQMAMKAATASMTSGDGPTPSST